ncbi:MAG: hypothetical protein H3C35_08890 [Bacteroidetes bacterium]|nr:hypothetical protein [Bacteroidota bacterium]
MKKYFILGILAFTTLLFAQEKKIDFRTADIKYLNKEQLKEFAKWRDEQFKLMKTSGLQSEIKSIVIQGNKIHSIIYNTGAISSPGVQSNVVDLVWNGLGYGYEFGPLVGSRVPKSTNPVDSVNIVIDGFGAALRNTADGDFAPDGITKWGWLPKPGYSAPDPNRNVASWGARTSDLRIKPKSWPDSWYNKALGVYVYPSFLGGNSTVPDEEVYYVVDDSTDAEFDYYPYVSDPARRGLGLNLEVRTMQFSNPLAEDIIFLVYSCENDVRSKRLPEVYFGMFGDPHLGGSNNYADDVASFIPAREIGKTEFDNLLYIDGKLTSPLSRNLVYSWDYDGKADIPSIVPGYFGYKFLESPNNSIDGIDNDDDGIIDESPFNLKGVYIDGVNYPLTYGIADTVKYKTMYGSPKPRWSGDEDGDWNKENDDVGIDGIFGTGDFGEGDGVPSQAWYLDLNGNGKYDPDIESSTLDSVQRSGYGWAGSEPNFGVRDVDESDQIGLRSFWSLVFGGNNRPKNDNLMYNCISSEMDTAALNLLYTTNPENIGDFIFLYGSGPFDAPPGHRERFSIALLMGSDLKDLLLNSETAQLVLMANYRFAQPPPKPKVVAVPGDGRVTLYWDDNAESAVDPFTHKKDFEGYKIYRSEDYTFADVYTITDGNGYPFLGKALYDEKARKSAQWHRPWTPAEQEKYAGGFHPTEYRGRYVRYYMGEPSDMTGLRHQYVDSTVTNGRVYYYAVVSFDHGEDSLALPPSESQSIIQRDAITQEFKFDVNTAAAVPNKNAVGLIDPNDKLNQSTPNVHTKGSGTGLLDFKVMDELQLRDAKYKVSFSTVVVSGQSKTAFSVFRDTPLVEHVQGSESFFITLENRNIDPSSFKLYSGNDTTGAPMSLSNIEIDSVAGRFRAKAAGVLSGNKTYTVAYKYYPIVNSLYLQNQDANAVFDGLRVFVSDDTLKYDNTNSTFSPAPLTGFSANLGRASVGTEKIVPYNVLIKFEISTSDTNAAGDYINPPDTVGNSSSPFTKKVAVPFRVINLSDTTKLKFFVKDAAAPGAKIGRWDPGEEIIILTPPPYQVLANNTMMGILIKRDGNAPNAFIPSGTSYTAKMKIPFSNNDEFLFTTKAVRYNTENADKALSNIIVVPNPYVVSSSYETPAIRSDLRGDRAIQFRNLPQECTIRIYTAVGELIRTLYKNDSHSFLNWDVLSSESARIGYGVYIYQVETPTGGTKIGRLGIIK